MESSLRVGEGGSSGCDKVKTKIEGPGSAILSPTLLPRRRPRRPLCPVEQRVRKERNSVLTGRLEGLVLLLPLGVLDSVRHFCFFGVVLKKEGERKRSKERDLMARNTKRGRGSERGDQRRSSFEVQRASNMLLTRAEGWPRARARKENREKLGKR